MKRILSYIAMFGALATLVVTSCAQKESYQPGEPDLANCYGVYFPSQEASGSHTFDPEMERSFEVTVARKQDQPFINDAITVPYVLTENETGIFQAGQITFEAGQAETTVEVTFENAEFGKTYNLSLEITDPGYASKYSANPAFFKSSVMVVAWQYIMNPQGEKALFEFQQGWWGETAWAYIKYYEVNGVRTCYTETQPTHVYNGEEYTGYGFYGTGATPEEAVEWTFTWYPNQFNSENNSFIALPFQYSGYTDSSGNLRYISDGLWYFIKKGDIAETDWLKYALQMGNPDGNYPCSYYDGNGGIYLFLTGHYLEDLRGSWIDDYDIIGIADGFTRTDYSMELATDYPSDGVTPIYVETGVDVASLKYAVYPGSLKADEIKEKTNLIAAGKEEGVQTFTEFELDEANAVKYAVLELSPEKTGAYTFVAVAFDEKNAAQNADSIEFNFISADDQEDYAVEVFAFTEDTPARYQTLHDYDSFAFGISGKDLTEVHVGIVSAAEVQASADILSEIKYNGAPVSSNILAEINADGGYYTVAKNLKASTDYYVIVWATNGSMDDFAIASYSTNNLPYVWNSLGKGTITDGFLFPLFGEPDATVACDIYEEASTPGLYMVTGFQLELAALFYGVDPSVLVPYEGGNWYNSEIVVDATDPNAVVIPEQFYGIYVNATYGEVQIETDPVGTLKDGVITFPANKMFIGLTNAGWYYANADETFAITLPSAQASASVSALAVGRSIDKSFVLSDSAESFTLPEVKYQRDAKAVKAGVKVSYERKAKETRSTNTAIENRPAPAFK